MKYDRPNLLLLREMQMKYTDVPTPSLEMYCGDYVSWRNALAECTCWSVGDAKIEIAKIFYGDRQATEILFLTHLR